MGDKACNRTYTEGLDCCINYFLRNKSCHPCQPGTFGFNCTDHCSPGSYGDFCGQNCTDCLKEDCHYTYGCPKMVTTTEIETTNIPSTVSSSLSKSVETLVSTTVKVLPTVFTREFTQPPNVVLKEQTNNLYIVLIGAGVIIFLLLLILLAVLRRLCVIHTHKNNPKNEIESIFVKNENEEDEYQEINFDGTMVNHGDVSGNRYNIIMEELTRSRSTKYQEIGPKIDKEGKSAYSHYHEVDNENSSSNENNGGYIEPESRRPTHSYIEVIEPMIHASDPANSDQDGGSSDKSDHLEEYQDTMNIETSDKSCSDDVNESKPHDSSMSDTYLDVVHATTTIFEGDNDSTMFTHPGFTHSIEPVTCMDRPIPNKGMISKMIIINGSVIIALLLVLIITISIRKYLMFLYWKRNVKLDHAPLTMINPVYSEAEGVSGDYIYIKQNKRNNEGDSRGKHPSCREELGLMCFKV
ncbi:uncharacterized protein LOC130046444 isoform X2 [Ostrea edulis]|uniref:uncharacterized protein LOC130046444 isoform X2 n=1 Tax=Ostrea edulis TaxID=37623 RepID=UPI0024AEAC68|nr:uncharacterized protein LOC130046444 isoform X2 [Ostrea edulis]